MSTHLNINMGNKVEALDEQGCKPSFQIKIKDLVEFERYDPPEDIVYFNEQLEDETLHSDSNQFKYNDKQDFKLGNTDVFKAELINTNNVKNHEVENKLIEETELSEKPKILVQRIFHQSENHVVEPKLDFVIAHSESEITKHVFGGLFNTKYYAYVPENYCKKHAPELLEFKDETLPKIGDKFESLESFRLYIDGKAKQWKYYLKCADSHRKNGKDTFVFKCVFAKPKSYISKSKGLRKRTRAVPLHDCPCRVLVKAVPLGAKDLTVIYVCYHHDHPLTDDYFCKLQHGRRLHPSIKEELMDILSLDVERDVVKRYFEVTTGYSMNKGYFANVLMSMRKNKIKRQFSVQKLKEMFKKIERIREELLFEQESEENPDDIVLEKSTLYNKSEKNIEVFNVLNSGSAPKRTHFKRKKNKEALPDSNIKLNRGRKRRNEDLADALDASVDTKSRLERRLQQLNNDEKTLQNVRHLQDSVRTETNPGSDNHGSVEISPDSFRMATVQEIEPASGINEGVNVIVSDEQVIETNIEKQGEIIESSQCGNDIFYENEVTVVGTTEESDCDYIMYETVESELLSTINSDNLSYCLEYGNDDGQTDNTFILLENLKNMPVIRDTELATVNITSENSNTDVTAVLDSDDKSRTVEIPPNINDNIEAIDELCNNTTLNLGNENVFEVIETNDKKILPDRQFVLNVILNKDNDECIKKKKNIVARKRGRPRKLNKETKCFIKSSSDDEHSYMKKVIKSEVGIDLNNLEDSDHYLIVVDCDSEKSISSCDEETEASQDSDNIQYINNMQSRKSKIKHDIYELRKIKEMLEQDVRKLSDVKNGLLKDIREVKDISTEHLASS